MEDINQMTHLINTELYSSIYELSTLEHFQQSLTLFVTIVHPSNTAMLNNLMSSAIY